MSILKDHTLCGEYEDGEHIIPRELPPGKHHFKASHCSDISWFALLPKVGIPSADRNATLRQIRDLGLPTVDFALHPKADVMQELIRLRRSPHMEGAV